MDKVIDKFLNEAQELIEDLEKAVLNLEKNSEDSSTIEEVFRVMHTFKGTANMFGFDKLGEFTHYLENIYDDLRSGKIAITNEILEITLKSVDYLRSIISNGNEIGFEQEHAEMMKLVTSISAEENTVQKGGNENGGTAVRQLLFIEFTPHKDFLKSGNNPFFLIEDLTGLGDAKVITNKSQLQTVDEYETDAAFLSWKILLYTDASLEDVQGEFMFVEDECDIAIKKVTTDNLLANNEFNLLIDTKGDQLTFDDLVAFTDALQQKKNSEVKVNTQNKSQSQHTIKVTYEKIDNLMNIASELVTTQARLSLYSDRTKDPELEEIAETVEKLVRQLRDESFSISLLPISSLSVRFERLIRDTSRELGKKIRFVSSGGDTELDKKIIENLVDPVMHLLRNAIDHGIESPEERVAKDKEESGIIHLKSYYSGTNVIIEIIDDGKGIDKDIIRKKAIEKEIIAAADVLTDQEIYGLIFHPGFSTAQKITNVSGRGVGMDVVKKAINNLRGDVEVLSELGKGITIRLKLPLSLSIIDGLLVSISEARYVIPLSSINKCYEVTSDSINPDMNDLVVLDGEQIPYINLRKTLHHSDDKPQYVNLVVTKTDDKKVAYEVDSIVDEHQAVIKPLGKIYQDQDYVSGATILGNGEVALVLDTTRLASMV